MTKIARWLSDNGQDAASKSMNSVIDIQHPMDMDYFIEEFIKNSFYLPVEALKAPGWAIEPIKVVTGEEFQKQYESDLSNHFVYRCEPSFALLRVGKHVGISERFNYSTGMTYIICKLWYGKK